MASAVPVGESPLGANGGYATRASSRTTIHCHDLTKAEFCDPFWVADAGPLKHGKKLSAKFFKATGMLIPMGIVIAGLFRVATIFISDDGPNFDGNETTGDTAGGVTGPTVDAAFASGIVDLILLVMVVPATCLLGTKFVMDPLKLAGAGAGAAAGMAKRGLSKAGKKGKSTVGMGGGSDRTATAAGGGGLAAGGTAAAHSGGGTNDVISNHAPEPAQTSLRDYGGDVPEQTREPNQERFDLAGMSEYEYRHMDEDSRKAAAHQLVDEGRYEELSDAVDSVGETTTVDYLRSGVKKGGLKGLAKGGSLAGLGALSVAGVSIASGGSLAPAAIGFAMAKGGAIGFGAGVASQGFKHLAPKDYQSLEGVRNELPKDISNLAGKVSDGATDVSDRITGGSSYAEGTTGDETKSEQTDVLQDQSTLDDVAKELEKENE